MRCHHCLRIVEVSIGFVAGYYCCFECRNYGHSSDGWQNCTQCRINEQSQSRRIANEIKVSHEAN